MPRTRRESRIFPINIRQLTVVRIDDVGTFRRITLAGEQLGAFTTADGIEVPRLRSEGFDDHVKVIVPDANETAVSPPVQVEGHLDWSGSSPGKDYTPVRYDPQAGEIDLEFARHPGGLASGWVEGLTVGDAAWIAGPKSSALAPAGFDWLLIAGDDTALPAITRLLGELPDDAQAEVFIEIDGPADQREIHAPVGVKVTWLHRNGAPPGTTTLLEDAVTSLDWRPGEVYCWLAGESQTLRPLRAHLKNCRAVPRDCLEVTGYWRRPAADVTATEPEEGEGWERLDVLLDVSTPAAVRAAIGIGLFARLESAPAAAGVLAEELHVDLATLRPLLRLLAAHNLLATDPTDPAITGDGALRLGALGELLVEDDHPFGPSDPGSFLDLSPQGTVDVLRTGRPAARRDGRAADERVLEEILEDIRWAAPSVVAHHDWSNCTGVVIAGDTAGVITPVLTDTHPDLVVRSAELTDVTPAQDETVLVCGVLDRLDSEDTMAALRSIGEGSSEHATTVLVAERTTPAAEQIHDHDALLDLQLRVAFGGGVRTAAEYVALFEAVGLHATEAAGLDIGWDMRMWQLRTR